ncbi:hypothetical protein KIW84_UN0349 [Lathyrus oleraceus]|nr:hypothetical protein KIW84_UN0349 [Pisum sativum]
MTQNDQSERPLFRLRMPKRRTENSGGGGTLRGPTGRTETKVGHSDPGVRAEGLSLNGSKVHTGDNRLMTPQELLSTESFGTSMSTHHILGLKKVPGFGCSPIQVVRELGLERHETVRFLSTVVLKGELEEPALVQEDWVGPTYGVYGLLCQ